MSSPTTIWGRFALEPNTHATWTIGPLALWVERTEHEWIAATKAVGEVLDLEVDHRQVRGPAANIPDDAHRFRCAAPPGAALHLRPTLADRPVVVRAEQPFTLLPADSVEFYVGSPIWLRLELGEQRLLWSELPCHRPSDTWFGPSTLEGELCYASKTRARLSLEGAPVYPARALTQVKLRNDTDETLVFERLKIPVAYLGLFLAPKGQLWTQALDVVRTREGAEVRVEPTLPATLGQLETIDGPRETGPNLLKRALHTLFN